MRFLEKEVILDKSEAVQRILRFSARTREWCEKQQVYFDDYNVEDYDEGYWKLANYIILEGIANNIIQEGDID